MAIDSTTDVAKQESEQSPSDLSEASAVALPKDDAVNLLVLSFAAS